MSSDQQHSASLRLALRSLLTIALVWVLATFFGQYFLLTGGWIATVVVGALLTLLNLVVRPVLDIVLLPLKLFAMAIALIVVNGVFVWLLYWIAQHMDPTIVSLAIGGGIIGWFIVAVILGLGNWVMKVAIR